MQALYRKRGGGSIYGTCPAPASKLTLTSIDVIAQGNVGWAVLVVAAEPVIEWNIA